MELLSEHQVSGKVLDHLGLIAATIEKLGLVGKIDKILPVSKEKGAKVTMGQRVAAMILNGLGFMDDRLYMFPEFLANKPVERLLGDGIVAEYLNDDALGRCLESIFDYGATKLFTELAFEIGVEKNLLGRSSHFDTSTISVYGEYEEETPEGENSSTPLKKPIGITYGYSKDHRPDLKQMVINLATTGAASFPIWMEAHSGNASDKKIMLSAAKKMSDFCKQLKTAPTFLYVGDSAMYENGVKAGQDVKWLSRVPERISEAKALLRRADESFSWKELGNGYRLSAVASTYGKVEQRWFVIHSDQAFHRESKTLDKKIACEKEEMEKTLWHLSNQHFECEIDARQAADTAVKKLKYHRATFTVSPIKKHGKKGRPQKDAEAVTVAYSIVGTLSRDEARIALFRMEKGRFILATNELDCEKLPDEVVLSEYKEQSKTESGFRFIKGHAFEVSSIFLKKPARIEALMMIMTLCLMVYSFAQYHLREALANSGETVPDQTKKPTQKPTLAWVCRMFHGVQLLHITLSSVVQQLVINLTETTKQIVRYFGKHAEHIYGLPAG